MSLPWLLAASLTVVGITIYSIGMKLGSAQAHPFGFVLSLNVVIISLMSLACLVTRFVFKVDVLQGLNIGTLRYAALCGIGAALIDTAYFLALRYGALIPTQLVYTIGGTLAVGTVAVLCFGEGLTTSKALGIILGIASLILITRPA
ncbi:MAG: hypothetical protein PHS57_02605 [Alphaproteobacteria bacterium]|nr:hypothetical protein [Alphaproteobacteria bacterium]